MSEENQKINVQLAEGQNELIIRHGQAEPVEQFRKGIKVTGNIDVPKIHLTNPPKWLTKESLISVEKGSVDSVLNFSYLEVNRDKMQIRFIEDAGKEWENQYTGKLEFDPRFEKFNINTGKSWTTIELANFMKMNRSHFETRQKAMELVSILSNFEAKVNKDVQEHADQRANTKSLRQQTVTSNIPENFNIKVPVFKGEKPVALEIEIVINPQDLSCSLISPEANDYVEDHRDDLMNTEIEAIEKLFPNLRIFEV